jgi:hypothetical protein
VSKMVAGGSDPNFTAQLMEKVNMLSLHNQHLEQQLETAQGKLEHFARQLG